MSSALQRLFIRPPDRSLHPAEEFLKSVNLVVGLEQLLEILSAKLKDMSSTETIYLVLYEPITDRYVGQKAKGPGAQLLGGLNFAPSDRLAKWLSINQCPLDVPAQHEVIKFLSDQERDILQRLNIWAVFPFIAVNRLTGAAFLSARENAVPYTAVELQSIMTLVNHTSLAIEHALLYQFQEDRLKKIFHSDKLATVGELAAGAAHEIRNPLTSIRSTAQFLKKDEQGDRKALIDGIIEEVDRIDHIIAGLLSLSKSTELKISQVDLAAIVSQTLLLLESEFRGRRIEVREESGLKESTISGDPGQLKQLFLNILLNSIQAMPVGGRIEIQLTESTQAIRFGRDQQLFCVSIKDSGEGIPEGTLPKVFDPFFTTKDNGTGLGLSISFGIVSKHGGEIRITSSTSEADHGTTVTVLLPRRAEGQHLAS